MNPSCAISRSCWVCFLVCFALAGSTNLVRADFVLDWGVTSPTSWSDTTGPTFTQSFDIDTGHAGNEMTVTISDGSNRMLSGFPEINNTLTGGTGSGNESLQVDLNYSNTSQFITVTVTFDTAWAPLGVENVVFTLFDVDRGSQFTFKKKTYYVYTDEIRTIQGLDIDGNTVAATSVTGSADNTVTGSGLTYKVDGTGSTPNGDSSDGNVEISFGTTAIKQFSFVYGNGPGAWSDPGEQTIAIGDLHGRKKIPEYHPAFAASLLCGLFAVWRGVRRGRFGT